MTTVDDLVIKRAKVITWMALSFGLWQLSWVAADCLQGKNTIAPQTFSGLTAVGGLCYVVACYFFHKVFKQIKETDACQALDDETSIANRNKAFRIGYFLTFGMLWILIPIVDHFQFTTILGVRVVATFAIVIPCLAFAYYELQDALGEEA